uniref:Uncharacterized protein n=1 Tax=Laticauda laticaudata TaxID=8630 RepID=A0A8C5WX92_LATLA
FTSQPPCTCNSTCSSVSSRAQLHPTDLWLLFLQRGAILLILDSTSMRQSFSRSLVPEDDNDKHPWWQNGHRVYYLHFMLTIFLFLWFISGRVFSFHLHTCDGFPFLLSLMFLLQFQITIRCRGRFFFFCQLCPTSPYIFLGKVFRDWFAIASFLELRGSDWHKVTQLALCLQ